MEKIKEWIWQNDKQESPWPKPTFPNSDSSNREKSKVKPKYEPVRLKTKGKVEEGASSTEKKEKIKYDVELSVLHDELDRVSKAHKKDVENYKKFIEVMRADRQALAQEVMTLREQLEKQNTLSEEYKKQIETLYKVIKDKEKSAWEAKQFAAETRSVQEKLRDALFCKRFHIPPTEFPITTSSVGFWITFSLESISFITKVRSFYYVPGTNNGLQFTLSNRKVFLFTQFNNRHDVITNVVTQASKFGYTIDIREEGSIAVHNVAELTGIL